MSRERFVDDGDADLTPEQLYQYERTAAVACCAEGSANCRHEWNAAHPDDPVTEDEQRAFEDRVAFALSPHEHGDMTDRR